ncbi:MAG: hypothetical protein B7Y90_06760 [Alphaproteobacteria bacterium 32-64-14]|nr:MAG: hypothetical protein B7Y90_06760 [Alphaproteobacteria bacterium 32-64-14]
MRAIAYLAVIGVLAGCKTVSMKASEPSVPAATVAVTLPDAAPGSAAATEAMLPRIVEHYCLERLIDGVPESFAVGKAGLIPAINPIHSVDARFPRDVWSTAATPRLFVWPSMTGGAGCTIAVFEGDFTRAIQIIGDAVEAGRSRRGVRQPPAQNKMPTYEQTRRGWLTFFAPGGDRRVFSAYASHDNPDPALARGLVLTLAELDK